MYDSDYYGYINSDILLSFNIFDVIEICKKNAEMGNISLRVQLAKWYYEQHEIAGRVHEVAKYTVLDNSNLTSYLKYLRSAAASMRELRHRHSAVYSIICFCHRITSSSHDTSISLISNLQ